MERVAWIWFWIKHAWYRILFRTGAKLQTPFYTRKNFNPSWIRQNSAPCNWYITLFVSEWIGRYWFMKIPLQIKSRKKVKNRNQCWLQSLLKIENIRLLQAIIRRVVYFIMLNCPLMLLLKVTWSNPVKP